MERLRRVDLRSINRAGVEGCIQSMQSLRNWPEETIICMLAVPDAASLLNSSAFPNLSLVDSFANQKINLSKYLKWPSTPGRCLLCFVVNCVYPETFLHLDV